MPENTLPATHSVEWKDIPGYVGIYSVSSAGQLRINVTRLPRKAGSLMTLRPHRDTAKGMCVSLSNVAREQKNFLVHVLVAEAFLSPRPSSAHVLQRHDMNPANNAAANLYWEHRAGALEGTRLPAVDGRGARWKAIPGYSAYEVSDRGEIRRAFNGPHHDAGDVLSLPDGTSGYATIMLRSDAGKRLTKTVHRLVASAFCKGEAVGLVVDHLNGNKKDNSATNLRWVTQKQNVANAHYTRDVPGMLNVEKCLTAIRRYNAGDSMVTISRDLGVGYGQIWLLMRGRSWKRATALEPVTRR